MASTLFIDRVYAAADAWGAIADRVRSAASVCVLTGAGVSAESGLPTFRTGGLWEEYRFEDVATPQAFARNPKLVWRFYNYRRAMAKSAKPNAAHDAIAKLQSSLRIPFTLITQNVDGLHQAAGSTDVIELHGNLRRVRCMGCRKVTETDESLGELPRCECDALLRPDIVWFGESLPAQAWRDAEKAAERGGVMLVVGTSAAVYPAAGLIDVARGHGAFVVEVNPAETDATASTDAVLRGAAGQMLPVLVERVVGVGG